MLYGGDFLEEVCGFCHLQFGRVILFTEEFLFYLMKMSRLKIKTLERIEETFSYKVLLILFAFNFPMQWLTTPVEEKFPLVGALAVLFLFSLELIYCYCYGIWANIFEQQMYVIFLVYSEF